MTWQPIRLDKLESMLARDLADCTEAEREFFASARIAPARWRLTPWGDMGGGFWVVAVVDDRVLWFNDIEDGFNVSKFQGQGEIPSDGYWCNQDPLRDALGALRGEPAWRAGPPRPIPQ